MVTSLIRQTQFPPKPKSSTSHSSACVLDLQFSPFSSRHLPHKQTHAKAVPNVNTSLRPRPERHSLELPDAGTRGRDWHFLGLPGSLNSKPASTVLHHNSRRSLNPYRQSITRSRALPLPRHFCNASSSDRIDRGLPKSTSSIVFFRSRAHLLAT